MRNELEGEEEACPSTAAHFKGSIDQRMKGGSWKVWQKRNKKKKKKDVAVPIAWKPGQERNKDALEALHKLVEKTQYTSCYCEENVWWLCRKLISYQENKVEDADDWESYAMFISNADRRCPVWFQRSALDDDAPCLWDYHVVLFALSRSAKKTVIIDLDSTLGLVSEALVYVNRALAPARRLPNQFHPVLRLVRADMYMCFFASDRRHMKKTNGSDYSAPPPRYNCIRGPYADADHNLQDYWPDIPDDDDQDVIDANDLLHSVHVAASRPLGVAISISTFTEWLQELDTWLQHSANESAGASTDQQLAGANSVDINHHPPPPESNRYKSPSVSNDEEHNDDDKNDNKDDDDDDLPSPQTRSVRFFPLISDELTSTTSNHNPSGRNPPSPMKDKSISSSKNTTTNRNRPHSPSSSFSIIASTFAFSNTVGVEEHKSI